MERPTKKPRSSYEAPKVETYSAAEILQVLGPAVAIYGGLPGGP
jgi:hypothetical protein